MIRGMLSICHYRIADGTKRFTHKYFQIQIYILILLLSLCRFSCLYHWFQSCDVCMIKLFCYQSVNKRVFKNNMAIVFFLVARNKCVYYCRFFCFPYDSFFLCWKLSHKYMYRLDFFSLLMFSSKIFLINLYD